ncbi:MAG TPA: PaaI family thioesterase [Solimonas sp.]|nr:PaaI family thioesterase [Solimonas sp.]
MDLKLREPEVETLIRNGLPSLSDGGFSVEEVRQGYARVRLAYNSNMLRPGNVLSGPTLFTAADLAMYALVLSHIGPELMAVTANLNINFLSKARPGDVIGEAKLLKLGRRLAVMEVALSAGGEVVAHVTGSYALPLR